LLSLIYVNRKRGKKLKDFSIHPLSEDAVLIHFGHENQNIKVKNTIYQIERFPFPGLRELVPAYHTLTVYYDPFSINGPFPFETVKGQLETILKVNNSTTVSKNRYFEIPVCYESDLGPDLFEVATFNKLTVEEAIHIHSSVVYEVMFIGFSPGFPFLGGLDHRLHFPRKTAPRLKVHQGSVGIAGQQTGVYSLDSPGGWQIIGRTPVKLFNINNKTPNLLNAGDKVKFTPISQKEFHLWEDQPWE
jgi:inhibitor of KinA